MQQLGCSSFSLSLSILQGQGLRTKEMAPRRDHMDKGAAKKKMCVKVDSVLPDLDTTFHLKIKPTAKSVMKRIDESDTL